MHERKWNTALAFLVAAGGLALSTYFPDPVHKMAALFHLRNRPVCDRAVVLDIVDRLPQRHGCRRRYRADQFDRQSRWLRGTLPDGVPEGRDRRVRRRVA